jgi:hypothetical protein
MTVSFDQPRQDPSNPDVLTLCEVRVYGGEASTGVLQFVCKLRDIRV